MAKSYRKKLFTTGEIAIIMDTTSKTVIRWIDQGLLKGFRYPNMVERRIHRDAAREFFLSNGYDWAVAELDAWDDPPASLKGAKTRAKKGPPKEGK